MKFRQKIVLFLVIVVVDLILCGVTLRMWKGEGVEKDFKGDLYHERNKEENESGEQEDRKDRNVMSRESDMVREKETDMRKYVALTFDDGPNSRYTKPLLDGLRERGIRASFFLVGECIDGKEDLVKQMAEDGHLIGVHCMTHKDLTKEPLSDAKKEICETGEKIRAVTGVMPVYVPAIRKLECEAGGGGGHDTGILGCRFHRLASEEHGKSDRKSLKRYGGRGHHPDA